MPCCPSAGLCSLHIHDATIEISSYPVPIVASHRCSTIRLSKIRFIVNSSVEKHLHGPGEHGDLHHLFVAHGHKSTLLLEDCELETTFDCPSLSRLVACTAAQGGKVRKILGPAVRNGCKCILLSGMHCPMLCSKGVYMPPEQAGSSVQLQSTCQLNKPSLLILPHVGLQVTMGNCKFSGFRRVLVVDPGSQAHFKDFVVDVTIPGSYGGAGMHNLVVGASLFVCVPPKV
jgi:hypothetical protein